LISGKCGIYPILDEDVALAPQDAKQNAISHQQESVLMSDQQQLVPQGSQIYIQGCKVSEQLTDEMITKFIRQGRYNIYDSVYQKWLETNNLVSTTPNSIVETLPMSKN